MADKAGEVPRDQVTNDILCPLQKVQFMLKVMGSHLKKGLNRNRVDEMYMLKRILLLNCGG